MILLIIFTLIVVYIGYFYHKTSKYPKGPFPFPLVGNILQIENPSTWHYDLERWRKEYGDLFTFYLFGQPIVALMRYDVIKEALIANGEAFVDRSGEYPETLFQITENGGVTFSSGANWREQRRTALHILRDFGVGRNIMEQQIQEQLEHFVDRVRSEKDKDHVNFRWPIQVLIANVINQQLYGFSYPHNNCQKLMSYVEKSTSVFNELITDKWSTLAVAFPPVKHLPILGYLCYGQHKEKYNYCLSFVQSDVRDALEDYSKDQEPRCFAQAYYQKMDSNEYLTMDQLYNVCSDFFIAGMETTTTTLRWAVLQLAKHPDIQEKVRREIAKVVGFDRLVSMKDKNDMPYTSAFITELQRNSNVFPVNIMRRCNKEVLIDGHLIPKGAIVLPQIYGALVDEKRYPDPDDFRPKRFLNQDGTFNTDKASQSIPFSMGKRQCAGESLARAELFLAVVTMIQKFKFFPSPDQELDLTPMSSTIRFPKDQTLRVEEVDSIAYI